MGVISDYFALQRKYECKYGDKTVLLMQIGSFYEIYEYSSKYSGCKIETNTLNHKLSLRDEESVGHAADLSMILHMRLTSKNKEKNHSLKNPFMMGFPCVVYKDHKDIILMNGYTIIRIDQVGETKTKPKREIVEISTIATNLDHGINLTSLNTNLIISIYIEKMRTSDLLICGISSIDVSTGKNTVCEIYDRCNDSSHALHEIYRFVTTKQPAEILIHLMKIPKDQEEEYHEKIISSLDLNRYPKTIIKINNIENSFLKSEYQEEFLNKIFIKDARQPGTKGPISVIDKLNLELFHYGRISYLILLQYCYEHDEFLISKLQYPETNWINKNYHLILTHNAINQLDIIPTQTSLFPQKRGIINSLISILDQTKTKLGSRFLRKQLLNPITNINLLNEYYEITSIFISNKKLQLIGEYLQKIPDIEKLQRKAQIKIIKPQELVSLFQGYLEINKIYLIIFKLCNSYEIFKNLLISPENINDFNSSISYFWKLVDMDKLNEVEFNQRSRKASIKFYCTKSFINPNVDKKIDQLVEQYNNYRMWYDRITENLEHVLKTSRGKKLEILTNRENNEINIQIFVTPAKAKKIKNNISQINKDICGNLEFIPIKKKIQIISTKITQCLNGLELSQIMMEKELYQQYLNLVDNVAKRFYFNSLNNFVSKVDFICNNAKLALKHKYYRPVIHNNQDKSFFEIKSLRHPIIEQISSSEYIPNDISLGKGINGLLLYGVNSTGKTSLAKAIGLAIIMAQAGMYVAGELIYYPYQNIITRLSGNDNLLQGKSSFIVEASEIRTIEKNANRHSLVLGDELCRGTESLSGMSLVITIIEMLINRECSFVSSSHMHKLPDHELIKEFVTKKKLRIAHLTTIYDRSLKSLVFSRKLEDGPGSSLYGLEVCRSLGFHPDFLDRANQIRQILEKGAKNLLYSTKTSKYNSNIYIDECYFCQTTFNLHSHHLKHQADADDQGFINHIHKNKSHNLLVLCQFCHQKVHSLGVELVSKQTLNGTYLTPKT